ncbi:MAG: LysR family transcriptional regulator [Treponema sp.]|nr:LysR family transcriptional regulator [Treponema sp.]
MDLELLQERARVIRNVRRFFDERNYVETDTPVLAPDLIPESCLEVFETTYLPPAETKTRKKRSYFLTPSPEIWMKRLIADHRVDLYQIGKCFRNGESIGRLHSPEFTMLEYYTMDANYEDSLDITEALFAALLPSSGRRSLSPPFLRLAVEDAFREFAGFSLFSAVEKGSLEMEARAFGLDPPANMGTAALYDLIFVHTVEPNLPRDKPVALMDYPAFVPCLAKKSANGLTAERWELYVRGVELANCYSEETDPEKVRSFFEAEAAVKAEHALTPHAVDMDYWKVFSTRKEGYPRCSGVAMGVDRLIMSLTGRSSIDSVLPFPMPRF